MKTHFLSVSLCCLAWGWSSTGMATGPELAVDVDVNSEVWIREEPMTEADVDEMVGKFHARGCRTLLVRAGFLGLLPYQTELTFPMSFDADHARANPDAGVVDVDEKYISQRTAVNERYARVIAAFNPPEAFIKAGHKRGMKVIIWLDIFDDGWPGYRSKFLTENPHCQWTAKDGKTYFKGVTSYAWPEARAFRVAQARELLAWGADGIHCSTSSHCRHLPNVHEEDFYGFEQPVVDAFKSKHGVDIRTADSFDKEAWHDIKGEAMVELYRELAELCHAEKKELWIGLQLGRYTHFCADPHFGDNVVMRYTNHWERLVDEGIADVFILGDYEKVSELTRPGVSLPSQPSQAYWSAKKDIVRKPGEDLYAWAARTYQGHCKGKTKLFLHTEWLSKDKDLLANQLRFFADRVRSNGFDGIDVHEIAAFEADIQGQVFDPQLSKLKMDVFGRFAEVLAGKE